MDETVVFRRAGRLGWSSASGSSGAGADTVKSVRFRKEVLVVRQPRQERGVQTRRQLLRAAAEVFDESGFAGASIKDILQQAELTAGALYFHF
ncbi:TetR family transcriptional regulator, partial [Streptomyces humidus]|uniref:TetR family transcriptional regulator n=1 Tax=Streptomyces humidus TaxID=52259 RepID=UPI003317695E